MPHTGIARESYLCENEKQMSFSTASAFSPGSVTCFFSPSIGTSPSTTYSKGCAITLKQGVRATVQKASSTQTSFNDSIRSIPPVDYVIQKLAPEPVAVSFETPLPLGCGFGLSAACCLSSAFAIAKLFDLGLSRTELGMVAHEGEVAYRTGLGDVSSQLCGGVVYRQCINGPLDSQRLVIKPQPIYFRIFDELETAGTLNNATIMQALAKEGSKANEWLLDNMDELTLDKLLSCARKFAEETKLLTNASVVDCVQEVLAAGGQATMIMLGQGVLSTIAIGDSNQWIKSEIDEYGTRY